MRYYISLITIAVIGISIFTACEKSVSNTPQTAKTNSAQTANSAQQANSAQTSNSAQPSNAAPVEDPLANVPRISLADAKKAFDEGNVVFVDTRAEFSYKPEHVKGAINIPAEAFQTRYAEVPKNKKIITYCS